MIQPAYCNGCGKRLEVPAGYGKSKIRCPDCGVFTELPKEIREQGQASDRPKPAPPPSPTKPPVRPKAASEPTPPPPPADEDAYTFRDEPAPKARPPRSKPVKADEDEDEDEDVPERETLIESTEEDDLNPYTVTGDAPTKVCPECDKKVDKRAKACVHCGYNFATKEKAKRTFTPVHQEWEEGYPFDRRLMAFIAMQVINFFILVASMVGGYGTTPFVLVVMMAALQAFLAGTYGKLTLDRTQKGKVTMTTQWRVAFLPQPVKTVRWKEHESLIVTQANEFNAIDWCFALILLSYGCLPGILFWWFVIHSDKFTVTLCKDHGFPETPIFRSLSQERAQEIMKIASETTTLPIHT
jgi:hypothetical protein